MKRIGNVVFWTAMALIAGATVYKAVLKPGADILAWVF